MRKTKDVFLSIAFAVLLIWVSLASTALVIASNEDYYKSGLRESGIYSTKGENGTERRRIIRCIGGDKYVNATLSDDQLDAVVSHIVGYLFGDVRDFTLILDGVSMVDGEVRDGVSIFGERAISHMKDVKALIRAVEISLIPSAAALAALLIYLIKRT